MSRIPDEFAPLYVRYTRDKAIRKAGNDGELMFVRSIAHVRAERTDGRIEDFDLIELGRGMDDPEAVARKLVEVKLWVIDGDGWGLRSWGKWQPNQGRKGASRIANHERWHVKMGVTSPECELCADSDGLDSETPSHSQFVRSDSERISDRISDCASDSSLEVEVEREVEGEGDGDPSLREGGVGGGAKRPPHVLPAPPAQADAKPKASRGKRLEDGFVPSEKSRQVILSEFPNLNLQLEHEKFADHWKAQPGQKGVKLDWDATWRNWMRRAGERNQPHQRPQSQPAPNRLQRQIAAAGIAPPGMDSAPPLDIIRGELT